MPKGSKEMIDARKEEIIAACAKLYETMSFKEITIKEIGNATTFTRTSIYNYFQTKEEIFLALLQKEYEVWIEDIADIYEKHQAMTRPAFAEELAHSVEKRGNLLKLLSMNHYDMEANSRMEQLVAFKQAYGKSMQMVHKCLDKFFAEMKEQEKQEFLFSFFPFLFGIYPYTVVTDKQREAMKQAGVAYIYMTIYEITLAEVKKLLKL